MDKNKWKIKVVLVVILWNLFVYKFKESVELVCLSWILIDIIEIVNQKIKKKKNEEDEKR